MKIEKKKSTIYFHFANIVTNNLILAHSPNACRQYTAYKLFLVASVSFPATWWLNYHDRLTPLREDNCSEKTDGIDECRGFNT